MRSLERISRDHGRVVEAWGVSAPDDLKASAWVTGIKHGKLEIGVNNAAIRHRVDRWLRSGGLETIRDVGKVRIKAVTLRIESKTN